MIPLKLNLVSYHFSHILKFLSSVSDLITVKFNIQFTDRLLYKFKLL